MILHRFFRVVLKNSGKTHTHLKKYCQNLFNSQKFDKTSEIFQ